MLSNCIPLKSATAVRVGLIQRPLVIPFAPPVWLIVVLIESQLYTPVPEVGLKVSEISWFPDSPLVGCLVPVRIV